MSKRSEHLFQFTAAAISDAARSEAEYHEQREAWWREEQERAAAAALEGAGVELRRMPQTGGERIEFVVSLGDQAEGLRTHEAFTKAERHRQAAERFRTDERVYGSQVPARIYELDTDDVHHFRLDGDPRED